MNIDSVRGNKTGNCDVTTDIGSLEPARVEHLYYQGIWGIRGSFVAALILTISLWSITSHWRLVAWLVCYTIACGAGEALFRAYCKSSDREERAAAWGRRFTIVSIIGGILWGATVLLLFPPNSIFHQALLTFVLGGMSVGIIISHGAFAQAHLPFLVAVYTPLIGRYFYEGDEIHVTMGILLLIFMLYLVGAARRMLATVTDSLNLRFQNQALIEGLRQEKAASDSLNEILHSEVRERRQAQEALLESEARYHQLFEVSPYPVTVHSGHAILRANPAAAAIIGAPDPAALLGRSIWDFVHPDVRTEAEQLINRLEENGEAIAFIEARFLALDGAIADVEVVSVLTTCGGAPAILSVGRDITEAKKAEERLRTSLEEKEILLREIHHRVKNNLQVISSLLRLQFRCIGRKSVEEIFFDTQNRLLSMSLVHERLYQAQNVANIDFREYIDGLLSNLFQSFGANKSQIRLKNNAQSVLLSIDTAISCGLIVNELVSNCLKHAFPGGRKGLVRLALTTNSRSMELAIADNGVGMPANVDIAGTQTLGLRLVNTLVRQLGGEISIHSNEGTEFRIQLPMLTPTP